MTKAFHAMSAFMITGLLLGSWGLAAAQNAGPGQGQSSSGPGPSPADSDSEDRSVSAPVLHIASVEVIRSAHPPVLDIIRVRGLASSSGWEDVELVPLTRGVPADGILELVLVGRAPGQAAEAKGFETVEAIFPLESDHPFKGVNVHSASESVIVIQLPGYAEGKNAGEDCSKCVGRTFVAKGAAAPSGKPASELVREEQLPAATRILRPSEGIPSADSNPNRLTLILNKEGKITTAVWD